MEIKNWKKQLLCMMLACSMTVPMAFAADETEADVAEDVVAEDVVEETAEEATEEVAEEVVEETEEVAEEETEEVAEEVTEEVTEEVVAEEVTDEELQEYFASLSETMTRADVLCTLYAAYGEQAVDGTADFVDMDYAADYAAAAIWAYEMGIAEGNEDGTLAADNAVMLMDAAVMLYRFAPLYDVDTTIGLRTVQFVYEGDWSIPAYAEDAIKWGLATGILAVGEDGLDLSAEVTFADFLIMMDDMTAYIGTASEEAEVEADEEEEEVIVVVADDDRERVFRQSEDDKKGSALITSHT